ncbi:hypothetical protein XELAEV_18047725mg [Xenopus laevis]|uniref:Uncharacterized protein n=1 Tax=Xenopus laevis TaxID=8355 RepID=A0A974H263_XENLA|nr:hypothetical protein XELAEV_18047725mg [Xenopus laevis]
MVTIRSAVLDLSSLASSHSLLTAGSLCWKAARLDEELKCPHNMVSPSTAPGCFTCRRQLSVWKQKGESVQSQRPLSRVGLRGQEVEFR